MKKITSLFLAAVLLFGSIFVMPLAAVAEEPLKKPVISSVYVHIEDHMTAYFTLAVPEGTEGAGLVVSGEHLRGTKQADGTYLVAYGPIYMQRMTDVIKVEPWSYTDGRLLYNKEYAFSVMDYAMRLLADSETDAPLRRVLLAMLNYGAVLQNYFKYSPYNLPDAYLSAGDRAMLEGDYTADIGYHGGQEAEGISFYGANLVLDEYLRLNFVINYENPQYIPDVCRMQVSLSPDFSDYVSYAVTGYVEGRYSSVTDPVPYDALRERVYMRLVLPNGDHSETISYSIEVYAKNMVEKDPDPTDPAVQQRLDMLHRMIELSDALNAYKSK